MIVKAIGGLIVGVLVIVGVLHFTAIEPANAQSALVYSSHIVLAKQSWTDAVEYEGRMCIASQDGNIKAKYFWARHLGKALREYASATGHIDKLPPCGKAIALVTLEKPVP